MANILSSPDFSSELTFTASRSSGPGGQHVNKVSTKMELRFHVGNSALLTEEEKVTISEKLKNRITQDGFLVLVSQSERTQSGNRERVTEKFYELLRKALTPRKKRKPTHPSRASKEKRLEEKREQSDKKSARKPVR